MTRRRSFTEPAPGYRSDKIRQERCPQETRRLRTFKPPVLGHIQGAVHNLINNREFDANGKLPFVLPVVIYNGGKLWDAPLGTQGVIAAAPEGMERFAPHLDYFLIDEGRYAASYLSGMENLAAAVFLIETQTTVEGMHMALNRVLKWADSEKNETLSAAIAKLARRVIRKSLPDSEAALDQVNTLSGVVSMLAENIDMMVFEEGKRGEKRGGASMLKSILNYRFGPLPSSVSAEIDAATPTQMAEWSMRLLTAPSLDALFAPNQN